MKSMTSTTTTTKTFGLMARDISGVDIVRKNLTWKDAVAAWDTLISSGYIASVFTTLASGSSTQVDEDLLIEASINFRGWDDGDDGGATMELW